MNQCWNTPGIQDIMNLTLVPYGNAQESKSGGSWQYQCQHGPSECAGNIVETCTIYNLQDPKKWESMIYCAETSGDPGKMIFLFIL